MINNLRNRFNYVVKGEEGASNIETIIFIGACLLIGTAIFIFKDKIIGFLTSAGTDVDNLKSKSHMSFGG